MRLYPFAVLLGTRPPYRPSQNPRGRSTIETTGLARDERDTPAAHILIERRGVSEHSAHVRDAADVPRTDVLIEHGGFVEHGAHVRDAAVRIYILLSPYTKKVWVSEMLSLSNFTMT